MEDHYHLMEIPKTHHLQTPLLVSGFSNGDMIQVQGNSPNLHFSLQFNLHNKENSNSHFHLPNRNEWTPHETSSNFSNYSASSYMTPVESQEHQIQNQNDEALNNQVDQIQVTQESEGTNRVGTIVTRLRSGMLSPVKYYPRNAGLVCGNLRAWSEGKSRKRGKEKRGVLERVLRRHSFPIRPCNSYTFFVVTNWGVVNKSSSFGETSKILSEMWSKLPYNEKKVFEQMAVRDKARYQKQCWLLRSHEQEEGYA